MSPAVVLQGTQWPSHQGRSFSLAGTIHDVDVTLLGRLDWGYLHWGYLPILIVLSALHYVVAAYTLRAGSGRRLPLRENIMTQFSAAAANRLMPAGLGAAAVNARFLSVQGMPAGAAVAVVAALHVIGPASDLLLFLAILGVSHWIGGGAAAVLAGTGAHVADLSGRLPLPVLAALAGLLVIAVVWWCRRPAPRRAESLASAVTGLMGLLRRPLDLLMALGTSAATTLIMAVAFVISVLAIPGASAGGKVLALLVAYLLASAAGAAVPTPSGLGSTEAALIAVLAVIGISAGHAIQAVVLFRLITYWAPVPIGLCTARPLNLRIRPRRRPRSRPRT
jgi:uncharacterized membrane protein YbhN (UPF0104 family)